jgi:hypothetical protein
VGWYEGFCLRRNLRMPVRHHVIPLKYETTPCSVEFMYIQFILKCVIGKKTSPSVIQGRLFFMYIMPLHVGQSPSMCEKS